MHFILHNKVIYNGRSEFLEDELSNKDDDDEHEALKRSTINNYRRKCNTVQVGKDKIKCQEIPESNKALYSSILTRNAMKNNKQRAEERSPGARW